MSQETDPIVMEEAANLATAPERLEVLSQDADVQVRQAVAANPNTPWQTLEVLAWEFPQEFLHNPRGPLQLMGGPEQISEDWVFWSMLLRVEQIPPHWWQWLASRPGLRDLDAFRMHVQVTGETTHAYGAPQECDKRDLIGLTRLVTCFYASQAAMVGAGWQVPGEKRALGENVRWLAHHSADGLRRELVARNPWTLEEMLQALAADKAWDVRAAVAGNQQVPARILEGLARDKAWGVREAVAYNEQTPPAVLEGLARDNKSGRVREAVAYNEQTPPAVLEVLARDKYWVVRIAAAGSQQMPIAILRELARGGDKLMREAVAKNPQTPLAVLEELGRDKDWHMRRVVVMNEQPPLAVLEVLARDRDADVRKMAVNHPHLPAASRARLFHDPDRAVRHSVINEAPPFHFSQLGIGDLADKESASYLARPDFPPVGLERFSYSRSWQVRYLVALHKGTPLETQRALSHDGNSYVRAAARLMLREMEKNEEYR